MSVTQQDLSESRPPPKTQRSVSLTTPGIPWYRDLRILRIVAQIVFFILFVGGLYVLFSNLITNLETSDLSLDFNVYERPFTVAISEGISLTEDWGWIQESQTIANIVIGLAWIIVGVILGQTFRKQYREQQAIPVLPAVGVVLYIIVAVVYSPQAMAADFAETLQRYLYGGSMARAFVTGIYNTLRVVALSLVASTLLGIMVGIGLLSNNFLLRSVAKVYVEIFRNTPLLVQLFFIYRTMTLLLPFPRESIFSPEQIGPLTLDNSIYIINARGFYFVEPIATDSAIILYAAVLLAIVASWFIRRQRISHELRTGSPANTWRIVIPLSIIIIAAGWLLAGQPFTVEYPALTGPNVEGGTRVSIGFMALFLGLTLYTSAFIGEIVRAGIQSVPYGQIEAARSQGLTSTQVLNLVVLPQALRLIIPPLGNQYVNLGKNSSLGLIVNYADTYRIATIANNESGQAVPFFVGLMVIYLSLSLTLSLMTNLINRATRIQSR